MSQCPAATPRITPLHAATPPFLSFSPSLRVDLDLVLSGLYARQRFPKPLESCARCEWSAMSNPRLRLEIPPTTHDLIHAPEYTAVEKVEVISSVRLTS